MVKTIKAVGRTPLLACPDDVIASQRYDSLGKAKLWYIADAAPMSKVYVGFKEEISAERLYTGCMDGSIISSLNAVTPHVGDHFFISPGVVHCAEGGVTIVEVAESSPLDFTLTDWGEAKDSKAQVKGDGMEDMGIVAAMDFLAMKPVSQPAPAEARPEDGDAENLAKCNQFTVNKIHLHDAIHVVADRFDSFIVYYCLAGSATLQTEEVEDGKKHMAAYQLKAGEAMLVPAECEDFFLVPRDRDTVVIEVMQEPREEDDEYINKAAEAHIPGEDYDTEETEDDRLDYEIRHQSLNNIKFKN
jgi:mannose-6-phosphate isomerase